MPDPKGAGDAPRPILDLTSGYVQRVVNELPQQGLTSPWTIRQNWFLDSRDMKRTDLEQEMVFGKAKVASLAS